MKPAKEKEEHEEILKSVFSHYPSIPRHNQNVIIANILITIVVSLLCTYTMISGDKALFAVWGLYLALLAIPMGAWGICLGMFTRWSQKGNRRGEVIGIITALMSVLCGITVTVIG